MPQREISLGQVELKALLEVCANGFTRTILWETSLAIFVLNL